MVLYGNAVWAGSSGSGSGGDFDLYHWSGKTENPPVLARDLSSTKLCPEALVIYKNSGRFLLLSDDGSLVIKVAGLWECIQGEYREDETCLNKYLADPNKKTFRGIWLKP